MATNSLGTGSGLNQIAGADRDYLFRTFLENRYGRIGAAMFGQRATVQRNEGDSAKWHTLSKAGRAQTLGEAANGTMSSFTSSSITATLVTYADGAEWSRDLEEHGLLPFVSGIAAEFGQQHGIEMDKTTLEELDTSTNVYRPGSDAADTDIGASDVIAAEMVKRTILGLKNVDAPFITDFVNPTTGVDTKTGLPAYVAFVSPRVTYDLRGDSSFVSVEKYQSGNVIFPGEIGLIEEMRFIETTNADVLLDADAGTSNVDVEHIPVIAAGAFGIAALDGRSLDLNAQSAAMVDGSNQWGQKGWMTWTDKWVVKTLRADHVAVMRCAASQGANS